MLLQHGVNTCHGGTASPTPDIVTLADALDTHLTAIVTHGPELRKAYLGMLRGMCSAAEMVRELVGHSKAAEAAGYPIMTFLIDLEVSPCGLGCFQWETSLPQRDQKHESQRAFAWPKRAKLFALCRLLCPPPHPKQQRGACTKNRRQLKGMSWYSTVCYRERWYGVAVCASAARDCPLELFSVIFRG